MTTIGFLGLGAMGMPMARSLVKAGFSTRGFDVRESARTAFAAAGGIAVATAEEASQDVSALVVMVVNAHQVEEALFDAGALAATAPGAIVVVCSTCAPAAIECIAQRVEAAGRGLVDAPVSGGVGGAEAGKLTIMAGGSDEAFDAVRPMLAAMGDKVFHVGAKAGQGSAVKTVNQLLCGVHIAVAAEAIAFAEKAGVDPKMVFEIVSNSAASSWMLKNRGPRMFEAAPPVMSAVDIFVKDLGIVLDAGRQSGIAVPLAAAAHQMFVAAAGRGDGRKDDSQVIGSYRRLNGS